MPIAIAIIRQLEAILQLIEALSPSLSASEVTDIRRALARIYDSMGIILVRSSGTGGSIFDGKLYGCSPQSPAHFLLLQLIPIVSTSKVITMRKPLRGD